MSERKYDLVLFGATGFTGALTADYIAAQVASDASFRWALAGRNEAKLQRVKDSLCAAYPDLSVDTLVADAQDALALDALARDTTAVCTTVGPYIRYGKKLVGACAKNGTHYCDLTGETPFIRYAIDEHEADAKQSGARIVHCCGFDSIPSDLGTRLLQDHVLNTREVPCQKVHTVVMRLKGGVSGGTAHSLLAIMEAAKDKAVRRAVGDPYGLVPGGKRGPDKRDSFAVAYDDDAKGWVAPFVMATVNTRVVRRSNALLNYRYGEDFGYDEVMRTGRSFKSRMTAQSLRLGLGALAATASSSTGRRFLKRFILPAPGDGPDEASRNAGEFDFKIFGTTADGERHEVFVRGDKDPGYGQTAVMLGESALCLARDNGTLDALAAEGGLADSGILTPASAMGPVLIDRLVAAGMTFRVDA